MIPHFLFLSLLVVIIMGINQSSCFKISTKKNTETHGRRKRGVFPSSAVKVIDVNSIRLTRAATNTLAPASTRNGLPAADDVHIPPNGFERGESSNDAPPFVCEICNHSKSTAEDSFTAVACSHVLCSDCIATYVCSKLRESEINVSCPVPECFALLEAEDCRPILPPEVFERWLAALCEAVIAAEEKFHCPFVDCSALLIDDGKEKVTESECPNCRRLFCAQCKVPWHAEVTCDEFQKLNLDEKGKLSDVKWMKCPNCRLVTKSDNCELINCRCGYAECSNTAATGESSNVAPFTCEICTDTKTAWESFGITGCSHAYCSDCVAMYVRSKVEENVINIGCPVVGCEGWLEAEDCRAILPAEVFERWGKASSEALFAESVKFYCPFANCSALLIADGTEKVMQSECPNCRRLFCAQCKVAWHQGVTCDEYQWLNPDERGKEDLMLMDLAKAKKWRRCPNCKLYVAKRSGCMYIKCRCGYAFCYNCGARNLNTNHYCDNCKRTY